MEGSEWSEALRGLIREAAGEGGAAAGEKAGGAAPAVVWPSEQMERLIAAMSGQARAVEANTSAVSQGILTRVAEVAKGVTGGGLATGIGSAMPLVPALMRLFGGGGGKEEAPPPPPLFTKPAALDMEAGLEGPERHMRPVDYDWQGIPRTIAPAAAAQVTVNVQAMDSRSFLDHSDEIARAVREAMLTSHAINGVMEEI